MNCQKEDNIFFMPEEARWQTISAAAHIPEISIGLVKKPYLNKSPQRESLELM